MGAIIFGNAQGGGGGGGGGLTTANNGLTVNPAGNVQLGGVLIANTTIDTGINHELFLGDFINNTASVDIFPDPVSPNINLDVAGTGGTGSGGHISLTNLLSVFRFFDGTNSSQIQFQSSAMAVFDAINSKGFVYAADYHVAGIVDDRWIPDYGAVKALVAASSFVATNKVAGVMASGNLINFGPVLVTGKMYRLNCAIVFRSGIGTVEVTATFTDTGGNVNGPTTIATLAAAGGSFSNVVDIYADVGTNISIDAVITGTAIGDYASAIEFLI